MAPPTPPSGQTGETDPGPRGDPWHAFGYLVSGVLLYGGLGWALDRWLGTSFLVAIGILLGAGFGIYLTWGRFIHDDPPSEATGHQPTQSKPHESQQHQPTRLDQHDDDGHGRHGERDRDDDLDDRDPDDRPPRGGG